MKDITYILNVIIELFGKVGEAFILSGFVVFVLEEHPLALMVKDVSRSVIDAIKSNSKLKYNGWIMPHSSISGTWRRKLN